MTSTAPAPCTLERISAMRVSVSRSAASETVCVSACAGVSFSPPKKLFPIARSSTPARSARKILLRSFLFSGRNNPFHKFFCILSPFFSVSVVCIRPFLLYPRQGQISRFRRMKQPKQRTQHRRQHQNPQHQLRITAIFPLRQKQSHQSRENSQRSYGFNICRKCRLQAPQQK